jgi:dihydropteroate synthase
MLHCGRFRLSLEHPLIMGIVNLTPDSFSDGGLLPNASVAVEHALRLVDEGADILDIGGESTRPGAKPVPAGQELERIIPVLEALHGLGVPLSVDTQKPEVMVAAIRAGADMINDVNALQAEGALNAVAASSVALCLMHKQGEPQTMQQEPRYRDVVAEVQEFLAARIAAALAAGVARERLLIDPGFGFGKSLQHNLTLLRHLNRLEVLGVPLLVGLSRKTMLGTITGNAVGERVHASVAAAVLAVMKGARILRVHDVRATRDALMVIRAVEREYE